MSRSVLWAFLQSHQDSVMGVGGLILNVLSNPNHTPKRSISLQCSEIKFPPSQCLTAGIKLQSELQ